MKNHKSFVQNRIRSKIESLSDHTIGQVAAAERLLWKRICNGQLEGIEFSKKVVIKNVTFDFFCPELRMAIELGRADLNHKEHMIREREILALMAEYRMGFVYVPIELILTDIDEALDLIRSFLDPFMFFAKHS